MSPALVKKKILGGLMISAALARAYPLSDYNLELTQIGYMVFVGWCFLPAKLAKNTNQRKQYRAAKGEKTLLRTSYNFLAHMCGERR